MNFTRPCVALALLLAAATFTPSPAAAQATRPVAAGDREAVPVPAGGGVRLLERLRENLQQIDLTDEQKLRVRELFESARGKADALRRQIDAGAEDARPRLRQLLDDTRQQLMAILTPEQRDQFRALNRQGFSPAAAFRPAATPSADGRPAPFKPVPQGQDRPRRPATRPAGGAMTDDTMMPAGDATMGAGDTVMGGGSAAARKPDGPAGADHATHLPGPAVGEPAPFFSLRKPDTALVDLTSLKGRIIVLEFGSYSCPAFRQRVAAMEKLRSEYGTRAQFFVVYTAEAHPLGEWEVVRNKADGISVEQPKSIDARRLLAQAARDKLKIARPILLDELDNSTARAYGAGPNSAVVIGRDGTLAARQTWCDPAGLRRHLDQALKGPTASTAPAAAAAAE